MAPIDLKSKPVVFRIHPGAQDANIEYVTTSTEELERFASIPTFREAMDYVLEHYTRDEDSAVAYLDVERIVNNNEFQLEYIVFKTSMRYRRKLNRDDGSLTVVLDERVRPLADDALFAVHTTDMDKKEYWLCEVHVYIRGPPHVDGGGGEPKTEATTPSLEQLT